MSKKHRYFHDDIRGMGELLLNNWKLIHPTTEIYYREESDPNMHKFTEKGQVAVYINEGDTKGEPGGIAFDHMSQLKKNMHVYVYSMSREFTANVANEVLRILVENRLYPFNEWDIMAVVESKRIVPAYRFFQWVFKVELTDVVLPYPNAGNCYRKLSKKE